MLKLKFYPLPFIIISMLLILSACNVINNSQSSPAEMENEKLKGSWLCSKSTCVSSRFGTTVTYPVKLLIIGYDNTAKIIITTNRAYTTDYTYQISNNKLILKEKSSGVETTYEYTVSNTYLSLEWVGYSAKDSAICTEEYWKQSSY